MKNNNRRKGAEYLKRGDIEKIAKAADVHRSAVDQYISQKVNKGIVQVYFDAVVKLRQDELKTKVNSSINV